MYFLIINFIPTSECCETLSLRNAKILCVQGGITLRVG